MFFLLMGMCVKGGDFASTDQYQKSSAEASSSLANVQRLGTRARSALPPGSPPAATAALLGATAAPRRRADAPPRSPPDAPDALSARRAHHANPWFRIITQAIRAFKVGGGNWACGLQFAVLGSQLPGDSGPTRYDLPQSCDSVQKIRIKGQACEYVASVGLLFRNRLGCVFVVTLSCSEVPLERGRLRGANPARDAHTAHAQRTKEHEAMM